MIVVQPHNQAHPPTPTIAIAVIGGDARMSHVAERLSEAACSVSLLGGGSDCLPREEHGGAVRLCSSLSKAAEHATALLLPLPSTRDGRTVWCPRDPACTVSFDELSELLDRRPELLLFGGRLPTALTEQYPERVVDYYHAEALQLRNAYITAEAALMTAMQLTDRILRGATVAVIGYGRIGQMLSRLLLALGADVTVCARREEALLWAATEGCHPLPMGRTDRPGGGLYPLCYGHSVIFNTVPAHVLTAELLSRMEYGTLLVDLASAPFGVSDEDVRLAASENGLRYVRAPSLPGSYAPRDAGRIIADCVLKALARLHLIRGGDAQ